MSPFVLRDMGMSNDTLTAMSYAWRETLDAIEQALLDANSTSWDLMFANGYDTPDSGAMT